MNSMTATSADGTCIAFWKSGEGASLLLVHGATASHATTWRFVREMFEREFTVHAMDRRGRGASGDGPSYDLQREAEDVVAVVEAIGGTVDVVGHSFGGLCALEATRLTRSIRRLVLYESVPLDGRDPEAARITSRLERLLDSGDVEAMLIEMYRHAVRMPEHEIQMLRSQRDAWAVRLSNAPTAPRELRAIERYVFDPSRFRDPQVPVLLLAGDRSPANELANTRGVAAGLPDARVVLLPGQQHLAMYTAPELFVSEVTAFLRR